MIARAVVGDLLITAGLIVAFGQSTELAQIVTVTV
jgi:hypothetical protein